MYFIDIYIICTFCKKIAILYIDIIVDQNKADRINSCMQYEYYWKHFISSIYIVIF